MASTAIATLHDGWDCTWSQPGTRLVGVPDARQSESPRVCLREGLRKVTDSECQTCAYFEPTAATLFARLTAQDAASGIVSGHALALTTRALLVFTAALFAALGFVTLTGPGAVPFTVMTWLCGAVFAGMAAFMELPEG